MEGHHAVKEKVVLSLGNDFCLTVVGNEHRELFQVGADEIPDAIFCSGGQFEPVFKAAVGFIYGYDEVLFD